MLENLSSEDFKGQLDTNFIVRVDGAQARELKLIEVSDDERHRRGNGSAGDSFSVIFLGSADGSAGAEPLAQSIYRFEHERLGEFELFIVPVKRDARGMHYQAVFNRL